MPPQSRHLCGRIAALLARILDPLVDALYVRLQRRLARRQEAAQVTRKPGALVHVEHVLFQRVLVAGLEGALDLRTHVALDVVVLLYVLLQAVECCGVVRTEVTRIFAVHSTPDIEGIYIQNCHCKRAGLSLNYG